MTDSPRLEVDILTLHPELVRSPLEHSILGRAQRRGLLRVGIHDIREHGLGRYRTVDDTPYGGGAGMVLRVDVVAEALRAVRRPESLVLLCSPAGRPLNQAWGQELSRAGHLILICGHYEGIDARIESLVDGLFSIGDYVLTGGELAALVLVDVAARLIPGVLGNPESPLRESFSEGLLEHPHYTRPQSWEGQEVPEVLRSGNHAAIDAWRRESSRQRTLKRRPDLLSEDQRGQDRSDS